jgi:hypothetical protein
MPLRPSELDSHFNQELDYLTKLSSAISANHRNIQMQQMQQQQGFKSPSAMDGMLHHGKSMSPRRNPIEVAPRSRWDVSVTYHLSLITYHLLLITNMSEKQSHISHITNKSEKTNVLTKPSSLSRRFNVSSETVTPASVSSCPVARARGTTRCSRRTHHTRKSSRSSSRNQSQSMVSLKELKLYAFFS